ncbi:hypothetical protein DF046_15580 [Burkholderia cepacia]|nr:hypothetical protein DF046_15580 [Burkholderia cepacia]
MACAGTGRFAEAARSRRRPVERRTTRSLPIATESLNDSAGKRPACFGAREVILERTARRALTEVNGRGGTPPAVAAGRGPHDQRPKVRVWSS